MQNRVELLARRVQQIRRELFGADGIPSLALALRLPAQTWENYESGVRMPATVLLDFIAITGAEPRWLSTGEGERYRARPPRADLRAARSEIPR